MYSKGFRRLVFVSSLLFSLPALAQKAPERIDPPYWFSGMNSDTLELLVYGADWTECSFGMEKSDGVLLHRAEQAPNSRYAYLTLVLDQKAPAQLLELYVQKGRKKKSFSYELKERTAAPAGLTPSDIIYLITPDRFANGDSSNDLVKGSNNMALDRTDGYARHGGDLQGIIDRLDYIEDLGMTALWLNPVMEANEFKEPYHGYAISDHYAIDPHYGSLETYGQLKKELEARDMKLILDVVYNHFGSQHALVLDPPSEDWIHQWEEFTKSNFRAPVLLDPHAAASEKKKFSEGWFDDHMPDMNYDDIHLARYMIQNTLWMIESFNIDAIRIDTYAYPEQDFMAKLGDAVQKEFPDYFFFGETWVHGQQIQTWFPTGNKQREGFDPVQTSVTDFQLYYAIEDAAKESYGWSQGVSELYYTLAADWMYAHPDSLVTFADNHDLPRFFGVVDRDLQKFKLGMGVLLTTRGIPCLYYGTEVLMSATDGHGAIREDFPGGWPSDSINKFDPENLNPTEFEAFEYIKRLSSLRKQFNALSGGQLTQYTPDDGEYVYFRHDSEHTFMILVNGNDQEHTFKLDRYREFLPEGTRLEDQLNPVLVLDQEPIQLPARGFALYLIRE